MKDTLLHTLKLPILLLSAVTFYSCQNCWTPAEPMEFPEVAIANEIEKTASESKYVGGDSIAEEWWTLFNDPQLNCLIQGALHDNPTLKMAEGKIRKAEYSAINERSRLFPIATWNADYQKGIISKNSPFIPADVFNSGTPIPLCCGVPFNYSIWETNINFSYDFDFWGKNRHIYEAALGQVCAAVAESVFTRLAISISVAQVYYRLQTSLQRIENAKQFIQNRKDYLELVKQRLNENIDNELTLIAAENSLSTALRNLNQLELEAEINEHQLKALVAGDFCEKILPTQITAINLPKIPLPKCIPLNLLAHRADITAQLWMIESAEHQIEVVKAGFYPNVNLTGFFGLQSQNLGDLFEGRSGYGLVEPAISLPIFKAGALTAYLGGSRVNYDLAMYQYNQLILNAVKDVLDSLSMLRNMSTQIESIAQEKTNQTELIDIIKLRIDSNVGSTLEFLNSQQQIFLTQDAEIVAVGGMYQAQLGLIKAIGGGYRCNTNEECER